MRSPRCTHLHALADPLHFARPRHGLCPLMRLLQLSLLVLDASQQPLHVSQDSHPGQLMNIQAQTPHSTAGSCWQAGETVPDQATHREAL